VTIELSREHINAAATAAYQATAEQLGKSCGPRACEAVCRRQAAVIEAEFATLQEAGAAIACTPGCNFCCHQRVGVLPHEAIALLEYLRTRSSPAEAAAIERRILENARRIDGMTVREHYAANLQCAFLVDGRCSAYDVRPSACATYHSLSRDRCEYSYNHPDGIGTPKNARPVLLELQVFCDSLIEATQAGLKGAGLTNTKGELHQLLRALIQDPGAIERWCAGGGVTAA
jgi:Fe-S-cluster containining protein